MFSSIPDAYFYGFLAVVGVATAPALPLLSYLQLPNWLRQSLGRVLFEGKRYDCLSNWAF